MASGLLIKQKQLLAGDGIAINHGETASTISLAENALENAVRIYDATVEAETGVVTITDGTPVTDLRIGDEIRTPDGVYQKTKDSITTGSPADGTRIKVSGITSPAEANGLYILTETEKVWKHESADYWISQWSGSYWLIANTSSPSNPGMSIFYASGSSSSMPWEMSNWSAMSSSGSPVLENASTEQIVTDTISLFEYASLADDVTRLGNAVNQAGGLLQIDLETNAIPEEYLDTTRLLPETPEDGDVPVYNATATTGGGNDETVKLLIQPSTSENQIVDSAAGNVVPVSLSIEGDITVSEEGIMQFTQSQTISVPMAFSTVEMITGNSEWCLDFEFIPPTDLNDDNEFWSLYNDEQSYVGFWRGSMGDIVHMPCFGDIPGFTRGEKHLLTFEQWKDGETWKLSGYHNGSIGKTVETLIPATTNQDISFGHGNKRKFKGQIVSIRFRNVAPYRGTSFQPDATPYTVPQIVGEWKTTSAKELVSDAIDKSRLLPENASNNELAIKKVGDAGIDANTFLMLHFDEKSGTPVDSSQESLAVNARDTAVYSNGKFSRARNLNNSYLSATCAQMATGTGDFTYDGWFYLTATNKRRGLFTTGSNCVCFAAWEDNKFALGLSSTGNGWTYDHLDNNRFDFTFSANTWYHIAVVRNGNTLNVYVNGNSISSFDVTNLDVPAVSGTDEFKIGYPLGDMSNSTDIVDEFRFSNVARWTSNFTPPDHAYTSASEYWESIAVDDLTSLMDANKLVPAITEQDVGKVLSVAGSQVQEGNDENTFLLLHFDGNTTDSSDNARSDITSNGISFPNGKFNKAAQFAGSTSSYVAIPNTSEFPFSGDFTISFWAKANSSDRFGILFYESDFTFGIDTIGNVYSVWASSNGSNWDILQADSGYNAELTSDSGRGSIAITPGEWQHVAFVRSGDDWYLFVNGTMSLHKQRSGTVYNPQEQLRIGRHGNDSIRAFLGLIDEFKIDTVARWTSDFTPPEHAYDAYIAEGVHTEFTDINENIDAEIAMHNTSLDAHPMQGAATNDYNDLDTNCSWYLSNGDNTSNVNAPANGPFFVMTKKWTNSSGSAGAGMQIAIRNMTGSLVNQSVYVRTWSMSSGWRTWQKVGSSAMAGTPNYASGVNITSAYQSGSNSYTFTAAGWVYAVTTTGGSYTINGGTVVSAASGAIASCFVPVTSGDTVSGGAAGTLIFYPNR